MKKHNLPAMHMNMMNHTNEWQRAPLAVLGTVQRCGNRGRKGGGRRWLWAAVACGLAYLWLARGLLLAVWLLAAAARPLPPLHGAWGLPLAMVPWQDGNGTTAGALAAISLILFACVLLLAWVRRKVVRLEQRAKRAAAAPAAEPPPLEARDRDGNVVALRLPSQPEIKAPLPAPEAAARLGAVAAKLRPFYERAQLPRAVVAAAALVPPGQRNSQAFESLGVANAPSNRDALELVAQMREFRKFMDEACYDDCFTPSELARINPTPVAFGTIPPDEDGHALRAGVRELALCLKRLALARASLDAVDQDDTLRDVEARLKTLRAILGVILARREEGAPSTVEASL